jgi:hypothetical protein
MCGIASALGRFSPKVVQPGNRSGYDRPEWGAKDLNAWTLRDAIKQLGIDWNEFAQK